METNHTQSGPLNEVILAAVEEFSDWSFQHRKAEDVSNKITIPLYHYTDANGLKGIIQNEEIWLTDYKNLNDPSEITYGMEVINKLLREIGESSDRRINLFCKMIVDLFCHENVGTTLDFFIASLSRNGNDLGQWRGYGDNGLGYALGIAPHLFHASEITTADPTENCIVIPVVYGEQCGRDLCMPAIKKALEIVGRVIAGEATAMQDRTVGFPFLDRMARELIASELLLNSLMIKHPAYKNEAEVRLVVAGARNSFANCLSTRTRGGRIIPFIKKKFPVRANGSIAEIVVGPSAVAGAEIGVRALFQSDTTPEIRRSDIPYRSC